MNPGYEIPILGHGYVRYIDHFGTDLRIVEAARISYLSPSKGNEGDRKLLEYLFKNQHTSPFEQVNITFNIKMPIFCMRQFVRHRTFKLNEVSARYTELPDECYTPNQWRVQDIKNRQGSITPTFLPEWNDECNRISHQAFKIAFNAYEMLLAEGVAKELARIVLPVSVFTEIYVNCDLHNLMHFLYLRTDPHAQKEIQDIARAMQHIAQEFYPWTMDLWLKYKPQIVERVP